MIIIKDGCIIIFGFLGLAVISVWEKITGRNIGYYGWPNRSLGRYQQAVEAIYVNVRWNRVRGLYDRAKAEHHPAA